MIQNIVFGINGMNGNQSEKKVMTVLGKLDGIRNIAVDVPGKIIAISHDPTKVSEDSIRNAVTSQGIQVI